MDLFTKLKHQAGKINLMIEFTSDDLIDHFEHIKQDPSAECKICIKLNRLKQHVPGLKELIDTNKIEEKNAGTRKHKSKDDN